MQAKTEWPYSVVETTLDKRLARPGATRGFSSEMVGVDGSNEAGLKPFPGFLKVYTMDQLDTQTNHTFASEVVDFQPVDFRIGSQYYGYGFVYRAVRPATPTVADVFIDYWNSGTEVWVKCLLLAGGVSATAQMSVSVAGRFVYVFIEGRAPALFYIDSTNEKTYYPSADSTIKSTAATTNFGTLTNLELAGTAGPVATQSGLLRFNTTSEASLVVATAKLVLTVTDNLLTSSGTIYLNSVSDPGNTNQLWGETTTTWNVRHTAVNWSTAGGSFNATGATTKAVSVGYIGPVEIEGATLVTLVQQCLNSVAQDFTSQVDILLRVSSGGTILKIASKEQESLRIKPRLVLTFTNDVFFTEVVIGDASAGPFPEPGKKPSLRSPEKAIGLGNLVEIEGTNRPAAGQIVLAGGIPYAEPLCPDPDSGLCADDLGLPAAGAEDIPSVVAPGLSATVCGDGFTTTGFQVAILSPTHKQKGVSINTILRWKGFYTDGKPLPPNLVWDVFFVREGAADVDVTYVAAGLTEPELDVTTAFASDELLYASKYVWKVAARRTTCAFQKFSQTVYFETESKNLARKLEAGDYTFAYLLFDSKTGRKSALSEIAQANTADFLIAKSVGSTNVSTQEPQFAVLELVYDSSKFDTAYVYRSIKIQDAGGTMVAGILFLDAVVELESYQSCLNGTGRVFDSVSTDLRHSTYWFELEDKQLIYQSPYLDRSIFDEEMPKGGASCFYENTMLVSKILPAPTSSSEVPRPYDGHRGLGELRWSSMVDFSPELYPPFNRHIPTVPSNEVVAFARVGGYVLGVSSDRVYHIRKNGQFIKVQEMHEGYGLVHHKAIEVVGSAAYYLSTHGLKVVDSGGKLDEIKGVNNLFMEDWAGDLEYVQFGYDANINCLTMLNPVKEQTLMMWFTTSKITEVHDTNFDHVRQGAWPSQWGSSADDANSLTKRAMFLMNFQDPRSPGATGRDQWAGPQVYIVDSDKKKLISSVNATWNGERRITTLDFTGDSRLLVTAFNYASNPTLVTVSGTSGSSIQAGQYVNCYAYCFSSTNPDNVGKKARIYWNTTTQLYFNEGAGEVGVPWLLVGDGLMVSPIYFEWAGTPLSATNKIGQPYSLSDFFIGKTVASLGCSFTDVDGPPLNDVVLAVGVESAKYTAIVYTGTTEEPLAKALVVDTGAAEYASISDGEGLLYAAFGTDSSDGRYGVSGTVLTPGVRIFCSDLNFRLLACIVRCMVNDSERTTAVRSS